MQSSGLVTLLTSGTFGFLLEPWYLVRNISLFFFLLMICGIFPAVESWVEDVEEDEDWVQGPDLLSAFTTFLLTEDFV